MTNAWNIDAARSTYSVAHWSDGYVDIGADGRAMMRPRGAEGPAIALDDAIARTRELGLRHHYPGYATREPSAYDYKKQLRALEVLDWSSGCWQPLQVNPIRS